MNAMKAYSNENPDRVYGEVYEYDDIFWAEVIVVDSGFDYVTEKSADFATREAAENWLAVRKVAMELTLGEAISERISKLSIAQVVAQLRSLVGFGGKMAAAN